MWCQIIPIIPRIILILVCTMQIWENSFLSCFRENHVKANTDKCNLLIGSDKYSTTKIEDFSIKNNAKGKLLGVKFQSYLSFGGHVTCFCKKLRQKLHTLAKI